MDWNYVEDLLRKSIIERCPNLPKEIVEEFLDLTFIRSHWAIYGNNIDIYILGIAQNKYDYYYVGCDENYEIKLISCALEIKRNKERDNDFIPPFIEDFKSWCKESDRIWKIIRKNLKEYFKKNKHDKLLYFQDHILSDEHIVYDNEEKTKYHIEKVK